MARGKPFQKGFDERRHILSAEERAKGYAAAPSRIRSRIRSLYRGGKIRRTGETVLDSPEARAAFEAYREPDDSMPF